MKVLLTFLLLTSPVYAQEIVIVGLETGTHYLKVVIASDGAISVVPLSHIKVSSIPTDTVDPVDPVDPIDPIDRVDPVPTGDLEKVAKDLAIAISKPSETLTVQRGVEAIQHVMESDNPIELSEVWEQTNRAMRALYMTMDSGASSRWNPWLDAIKIEAGELDSVDKCVDVLDQIINGLKGAIKSHSFEEALLENLKPDRIIRLITAVIAKDYFTVFKIVIEIIRDRRDRGESVVNINLQDIRELMEGN